MQSTHRLSLIATAISIAGVALAAPAAAQAATTIGQLDGGATTTLNCDPGAGPNGRVWTQGSTSDTTNYDIPDTPAQVITSWATRSRAGGGTAALKVMSRDADVGDGNATYTVLHSSDLQTLTANTLNRFSVRIPVPGGGTLGLFIPVGGGTQRCFFTAPDADPQNNVINGLTTGTVGEQFTTANPQAAVSRLNLEATIEPDADVDGWGDETQDRCPGAAGDNQGCPVVAFVPPPPPPPDVTKPVLTGGLKFSRSSFAAAKSGAPFAARKKKKKKTKSAPVGTKVSFSLTEAASVAFTVERKTTGRKVKGKCKTQTRKNKKKAKCDLYKKVTGSFLVSGKAGANSFTFRGRIGGKALKTGNYRLKGTATDAARNVSVPTQKTFKIVR